MLDIAEKFFWPCDQGKGWDACREYCHPNASFKTDADTLVHLDRLEDYVEWMKDAHSMLANTRFEIKSIAEDTKRGIVLLYAIIYADNILGEEPQPIETDYVYAMTIEEDKIKHNKDFFVFTGSSVGVVPILGKGIYTGKINKLGIVKAKIN